MDNFDFKAILEEALNINLAANTPVSVSVYLDELAPDDVVACARNAYASAASHARITLSYLGSAQAVPNESDDLAVIVAGLNEGVGKLAADLRLSGVPVMVVTTLPEYVGNLAEEAGYPIPAADIIAPVELTRANSPVGEAFLAHASEASDSPDTSEASQQDGTESVNQAASAHFETAEAAQPSVSEQSEAEVVDSLVVGEDNPQISSSADRRARKLFSSLMGAAQKRVAAVQEAAATAAQVQSEAVVKTVAERIAEAMPEGSAEPYVLDDESSELLRKRMGEWIIAICHEKRLSLALAFPFVRRPLSLESVNRTAVQNAALGAVVFIPGADMPIMTANQSKMLLQIAAAYGQPMTVDRVKELAAVVAGGFACRTVARELVGLVPFAGFAIKAGIGYSATLAMGRAAIEYFEGGGGAIGLAGVVSKASSAAMAVLSAAQKAAGVEEEPEVDTRTSSQKAADTAKQWGERFSKVANAAGTAAGPIAQAALKTSLDSFVSGAGSMVPGFKRS